MRVQEGLFLTTPCRVDREIVNLPPVDLRLDPRARNSSPVRSWNHTFCIAVFLRTTSFHRPWVRPFLPPREDTPFVPPRLTPVVTTRDVCVFVAKASEEAQTRSTRARSRCACACVRWEGSARCMVWTRARPWKSCSATCTAPDAWTCLPKSRRWCVAWRSESAMVSNDAAIEWKHGYDVTGV